MTSFTMKNIGEQQKIQEGVTLNGGISFYFQLANLE